MDHAHVVTNVELEIVTPKEKNIYMCYQMLSDDLIIIIDDEYSNLIAHLGKAP